MKLENKPIEHLSLSQYIPSYKPRTNVKNNTEYKKNYNKLYYAVRKHFNTSNSNLEIHNDKEYINDLHSELNKCK